MATTKANAIDQLKGPNSISHQEALVKKIQGTQISTPVKFTIPAGHSLTKDLSEAQLSSAVYNWLRRCRHFTEGTISLCEDINARKTKTTKKVDFDTKNRNLEWEVRGKKWLSERVADILNTENVLAVKIAKDGLYSVVDTEETFTPESQDWQPWVELTPFRPPTF